MGERRPFVFVSHASADNARLKPVLVALLRAKIPLWFDKPNHPAIRIDDSEFAGFINGGAVWSGAIDDHALPESAAFLYFPSPATLESKPCWHEAMTALSRQRLTERYLIAPLMLDQAAVGHMHDDLESFQGYNTHTAEMSGGWTLTEYGASEVERLIERLTAHLSEVEKTPLVDRRAGARISADDALLVDRREQSDGVVLAFSEAEAAAQPRHPLLITFGLEDEEPRGFGRVTLPRRVLDRAPVAQPTAASRKPLEIVWPSGAAKNATQFATLLAGELGKQLQGVRGGGGATMKALAATLRGEGCVRVTLAQLPPMDGSFSEFVASIRSWCAFWNGFPFEDSETDGKSTLLPVLEVAFVRLKAREQEIAHKMAKAKDAAARRELKRGLAQLRKRARIEKRMRAWLRNERNLRKLSVAYPKIELTALSELSPVKVSDVDEWIDTDAETFGAWEHSERTNLRVNLKAVFDGAPELPMSAWAERARPLLKR